MLKVLFNIEDDLYSKTLKILGFKICTIDKGKKSLTTEDLRCYTMAAHVNSKLEKYRGAFTDKDVIIIGAGPSLEYLDSIPENAITIGINRAFKLNNIDFNYLFIQDNLPDKKALEEFIEYKPDSCTKFIGIHTNQSHIRIRQSSISRIKNREFYILNNRRPGHTLAPIDISLEPFARYNGTVFAVLQFCLFANAKRIYLAGFDCTNNGHAFSINKAEFKQAYQYKFWKQFKLYKDTLWEDSEIISINPINLKGMFKDIYTQSYIKAHPEIKLNQNNILDGKNTTQNLT